MPLFALLAMHVAVGLATALAAAGVLRTSPRPVTSLESFRALVVHEALVALPVTALVVTRAGDWAVSYAFDCSHLPSLVLALAILACSAAGVVGYVAGARLVRDHRAAWIPRAVAGLALVVALAALVARTRVLDVGSYVQHRGGFGLQSISHGTMPAFLGATLLAWTVGTALLLRASARATA